MPVIASLGEILIDRFPDYEKPGGAPCNVAYNLNALGNEAYLVSATGDDPAAETLRSFIRSNGIPETFIQQNEKPTGVVDVKMDGDEASYHIRENAAWDFIEWNPELAELAAKADAVCFSTLSMRSEVSRTTLLRFIDETPDHCIHILDVNLRPPWYSAEIIRELLKRAHVVKLNEAEFATTAGLLQTENLQNELLTEYGVQKLILTLGKRGSRLITKTGDSFHPVLPADTKGADSVGVGDAFISCVVHHLLRGTPDRTMMQKASLFAACVASRKGAMIPITEQLKASVV